jgi:hypothetical protein
VISEAINEPIPNGQESVNQQCFSQWYEEGLNNQVAHQEVADTQVGGLRETVPMLAYASVQRFSNRAVKVAFSSSGDISFPNIDWPRDLMPVALGQESIRREVALVVDEVDPGSNEWLQFTDGERTAAEYFSTQRLRDCRSIERVEWPVFAAHGRLSGLGVSCWCLPPCGADRS